MTYTLKHLSFNKAQLLAFVLIFGGIGGYVLTHSFAAGAANIWVSTTGDDATCVRGNASEPCASVQKACDIAQGGDTIEVAAGIYSTGFNLNGCNPASTITYKNATGANVFFGGDSDISDTSNVTIQGDRVGHGIGFSLGHTGISGTDAAPTSNITWNNVNLYCEAQAPWLVLQSSLTGETACNSALGIGGNVDGFTWNGGDQSDWATCYTSCTSSYGFNPNANQIASGGQAGTPTNITIENVNVKNYFDLDNNGSAGDHSESWMITTGSHLTFKNDTWLDCAPPATTGYAINNSCNTSYIFFGEEGSTVPTADYVTFEGNIVAPGHGLRPVAWGYDYPQAYEFHTSWLYNTIDGGLEIYGADSNSALGPGNAVITGSNMTFVGNISAKASYSTCFSAATYSHNMWFRDDGSLPAAKCGATDIEKDSTADTDIWADPATYDFSLLPGSGAIDAGESAYCPATDLNGTARPQGAACDAGAVEHIATASVWVSPTGDDSTCVRGDSSKPCATFNKAYQLAQPGDLVEVAAGTYPAQTINWDASKTSTACDGWVSQSGDAAPIVSGCVTFEPASGQLVNFKDNILIYGNDVRLLDFNLGTGPGGHGVGINKGDCVQTDNASDQPSYIILDGITAHNFGIDYSSHVAILNSTFNPDDASGPLGQMGGCDPDGTGPQVYPLADHVRLNDNLFENVLESAGHHDTCIHSTDGGASPATANALTYIVIAHNRFQNCAEQDMEIQSNSSSPAHDILVEDNYFAAPCSEQPAGTGNNCGSIGTFTIECAPITVGYPPYYNIDIRFNTFDGGGVYIDTSTGGTNNCKNITNYRIYGNIMAAYSGSSAAYSCTGRVNAGILYRYNVWDGTAVGSVNCGGSTNTLASEHQTVDPSIVNGAVGSTTYNFHLASSSVAAADFITPGALTSPYGYPATDYAGVLRPQGAAYDAGAYEYSSSYTPPTNPPATPPPTNPPSTNPPSTTPTPTPTPSYPPGDLNHDGQVDIYDLSILLSNYNHSGTSSADIDGNKLVNIYDLSILLSNYDA